ncbi:MAG: hypothetical protein MHPSP_003055, partial [Paramarteilia canceri]
GEIIAFCSNGKICFYDSDLFYPSISNAFGNSKRRNSQIDTNCNLEISANKTVMLKDNYGHPISLNYGFVGTYLSNDRDCLVAQGIDSSIWMVDLNEGINSLQPKAVYNDLYNGSIIRKIVSEKGLIFLTSESLNSLSIIDSSKKRILCQRRFSKHITYLHLKK